ncbi:MULTISPECIES: hypothetical protein [unclassified Microcystis]|jgi:hypothetical protein|uniref:hypothetical protein n=1 Tax=unclassified Microcystis TaxID=2643300 RepID=UPI001195191C|nr:MULTISPECIES: hypothetical protein [unclassified Microcystis]MCA2924708.1 hypothetical protein [Microcystis sp. M020S1]MCA2936292.1 hypothetical protein [Microcystis sp. M015S1]NCQ85698.1 hypothetical protein [Microcystis aeruginosa W13-18]NCR37299.1 hypothetical protein [Microcystis aeruginosa S11-05]NCR50362.1 hypothetical protein [Microcystis aeruginosa S11-01]NCS07459.1 hypothetical protein [Microcystis aeruginosa G13-07]NCS13458.1 hypothetical protein [Microcystis aeruginosa G13-09]
MSFDRTPNFTEKLATDPDFRLKVLDEIATDDELKDLTEEDLKAIVGGGLNIHQIYGVVSPVLPLLFAFQAGWSIGQWLNENTPIQEWIRDAID